jgi:glycosyltransferase involved in cell wall biosynthesis
VPRAGRSVLPVTADQTALLFGIVRRRYKGTDVLQALGAEGVPGWRFAIVGVGAPTDQTGVVGVPGFIPSVDLVATVAGARAVVVPYRTASQSATVVLAQALGAIPVASAVGGIPDQITDGIDGILIPPGAPTAAWSNALQTIGNGGNSMRSAAAERVRRGDREFRDLVGALA